MKPTASFIMNSFLKSDKRHIVITGQRRSGKSILIKEIEKLISEKELSGIITEAVPEKYVLLKEKCTDNETVIGKYCAELGKSNAMVAVNEGFSGLGISALKRAVETDGSWVFIDEIGYLESNEESFQRAVEEVFDSKRVMAVVRKQDTDFINKIKGREDVFLLDVDEYRKKVGCVIMASGISRRFGSNKLLACFNGKTLLQTALDTTEGIFDRRIVVTRSEEAVQICKNNGCNVIFHTLPDRNDTVRIGIEKMEDMDAVVFCPCDQPMITRKSLEKIKYVFYTEGKEIVRLKYGEKTGAPVLFSSEFFDELKNLPKKNGGGYILKKYPEKVEYAEAENEYELFDADTKEELENLEKIAETGIFMWK